MSSKASSSSTRSASPPRFVDGEPAERETDQVAQSDEASSGKDRDDSDGSTCGLGSAAVNPTRDALQEGIVGFIRPTIETIDIRVQATRAAQEELRSHIEALSKDLDSIKDFNNKDQKLEAAITKLSDSKKRIIVVANILQAAQDRLNKVHRSCLKESSAQKDYLESSQTSKASTPSTATRRNL